MKFYIVDAFTEEIFGGNPAGVVLLPQGIDFPEDEIMIKTARELRYSETAFIKSLGNDEFNIRYFTPVEEVELCGHATIASFKALVRSGLVETSGTYINHTLAGALNITIKDKVIFMDMAKPLKIHEMANQTDLEALYQIMGLSYQDQKARGLTMLPQTISTGLPDIIMPVVSQKDLEAITPDFPALSLFSKDHQAVGVHAFTLEGTDATCHVRNFAPLLGIDEEAATGTANGALTYYGYLNDFIQAGDESTFIQGEKMGRPSEVYSRLEVDQGKVLIQIGGKAVILAEGEINL